MRCCSLLQSFRLQRRQSSLARSSPPGFLLYFYSLYLFDDRWHGLRLYRRRYLRTAFFRALIGIRDLCEQWYPSEAIGVQFDARTFSYFCHVSIHLAPIDYHSYLINISVAWQVNRSYESEQLHRSGDVMRRYASHLCNVTEFDVNSISMRIQVFEHHTLPKRMIRYSTEIRERFLWCSRYALDFGQQITELYEKPAETLSLILR